MDISPWRILIIYDYRDDPKKMRVTIKQHLHALRYGNVKHELVYYNTFDDVPSWVLDGTPADPPSWLDQNAFDVVILHYSFLSFRTTGPFFYKWKRHFSWIGELDCLKIAIPQDEFDRAALLDEWLFDWNVSIIFSIHHTEQRPLYPIMRDKAAFYRCLPGYIDETAAQDIARDLRPSEERPYDIVYRARNLPYRFGSVGQVKHQIGEIVSGRARAHNLKCDISTRSEDAILGDRWLNFIASGKSVIGSEGGSSVIDWRGEIEAQSQAALNKNQSLSFADVSAQMPKGWDAYRFVTITPRHFEAIVAKTCQILVEGDYRGILEPEKHYIPLRRDFSNLDEVLKKVRDNQYVQDMVKRAYEDIYVSGKYTYLTFAKQIEQAIFTHEQESSEHVRNIEPMSKRTDPIEVLERQLVAGRHRHALLEAQLRETKDELEQMRGKVAELEQVKEGIQSQHYSERKSWLRFAAIAIILAVALGALISAGVLMLLNEIVPG